LEVRDVSQHSTTVEGLDRSSRKAAHSERQPLQRRVWVFGLLQHQHRGTRKAKFTGQEQADWASARNDNIVGVRIVHQHSLVVVRPERLSIRNRTDEQEKCVSISGSSWGLVRSAQAELSFPKGLGLTEPSPPFSTGSF
jgi:hypothetical protein